MNGDDDTDDDDNNDDDDIMTTTMDSNLSVLEMTEIHSYRCLIFWRNKSQI